MEKSSYYIMDNSLLLLIVIAVVVVLLVLRHRQTEGLGGPFNTLTSTPQPPRVAPVYRQPYCTNSTGFPVPCKPPCQEDNPACEYDYPVPVLSNEMGAYTPSRFCPGPPLC